MRRKRRDWICLVFLAALILLGLYVSTYFYVANTSGCFAYCDPEADKVGWSRQLKGKHGVAGVGRNFLSPREKLESDCTHKSSDRATEDTCQTLHIAIVCVGHSAIRRLIPLVKSLLFYRSVAIHFHFVVNDSRSRYILTTLFDSWNIPAVNYFTYDATSAIETLSWIPNKHYSGVYGLLKLTLPTILPSALDKVLVLDNDVLFNADPLEMLQYWDFFDSSSDITPILGLAENQSPWYLGTLPLQYTPWPALGRGFNTGVILMRLDGMRRLNWMHLWQTIANATLLTNGALGLADQDIFNAVIKQNPALVYRLPCVWNVQLGDSSSMSLCPGSPLEFKIIHFNTLTKSSLKDQLSEYFNLRLSSFLELSPLLSRPEVLQCIQNTTNHFGIVDTPEANKSLADDDFCSEYRRIVDNRIHLYYTDFDYISEADDVTLVTQLSFERAPILEVLLSRWIGPASIAVYLDDAEAVTFEHFVAESAVLKSRRNVAFHLVFKRGQFYPVNKLRNVALREASTPFAFLTDTDFIPSPDLYNSVQKRIIAHNGNITKKAFIVPAFESLGYSLSHPSNKTELLALLEATHLRTFKQTEWNKGHKATDYERWKSATQDYEVTWNEDYEPYVIVDTRVPFYDERFAGFGWNKVSHIMELDAAGYTFIILHDAFTVHSPHTPSFDTAKYRSNLLYRRCLKLFKGEFMKDLIQKYSQSPQR